MRAFESILILSIVVDSLILSHSILDVAILTFEADDQIKGVKVFHGFPTAELSKLTWSGHFSVLPHQFS